MLLMSRVGVQNREGEGRKERHARRATYAFAPRAAPH
jgi:hypothetical protein